MGGSDRLEALLDELREDAEDTREAAYTEGENTIGRVGYLGKAAGIEYVVGELEHWLDTEGDSDV